LFATKDEKGRGGEEGIAGIAVIADIAGIGKAKPSATKETEEHGGRNSKIPTAEGGGATRALLIAKIGEPKAHHGGAETRRTTKIEDRNNRKLLTAKGPARSERRT
jgi:hypothetical protein